MLLEQAINTSLAQSKLVRLQVLFHTLLYDKVLGKILKQRKLCVGQFLMSIRKVNDLQFTADDFGECFHTACLSFMRRVTITIKINAVALLMCLLFSKDRCIQ